MFLKLNSNCWALLLLDIAISLLIILLASAITYQNIISPFVPTWPPVALWFLFYILLWLYILLKEMCNFGFVLIIIDHQWVIPAQFLSKGQSEFQKRSFIFHHNIVYILIVDIISRPWQPMSPMFDVVSKRNKNNCLLFDGILEDKFIAFRWEFW